MGQLLERVEQNIGEHEIERCARPHAAIGQAVPLNDRDERANAVETRITARHLNTDWINVAGCDRPPRCLRCRDGEHAGPAADIENAARALSIENAVEREQTALGRAVVPGAEGERSLDLDTDPIRCNAVAVVRAVDHKPPNSYRRQPCKALGYPIARRDCGEGQAFTRRIAGEIADEGAQRVLIRRPLEVNFNRPGAPLLEGRNRGFAGREGLAESIEESSRRAGVSAKPGED